MPDVCASPAMVPVDEPHTLPCVQEKGDGEQVGWAIGQRPSRPLLFSGFLFFSFFIIDLSVFTIFQAYLCFPFSSFQVVCPFSQKFQFLYRFLKMFLPLKYVQIFKKMFEFQKMCRNCFKNVPLFGNLFTIFFKLMNLFKFYEFFSNSVAYTSNAVAYTSNTITRCIAMIN